jgi:anti-sigma factor RsiW
MPNHLDDYLLNEYLDSILNAARRAEVESHLAACPACAARLAELRALFAALESLPEAPLERDLSSAVMDSIRRAKLAAQPALSPKLRLAIAVQGLAALVLISIALPFAAQVTLWERVIPAIDVTQATAILADALATFNATWATVVNSAQSLLNEGITTVENLALPSLSALGLGIFFAAVSALWIVGNGLLLTRAYQIKR